MSDADRLAAALKQEQWAHTETAKRVAELEAICQRLHAAYVIEEDTNGFPFRFELRDAHRELQAALKGKDVQ